METPWVNNALKMTCPENSTRWLECCLGPIVGPVPVGVCIHRCRQLLTSELGAAPRGQSDVSTEFETWLNLLKNGTRRNVRTAMFNNVKKVIAWRMKEMCNEKSFPWLHTHLHQIESLNTWSRLRGMELKPYCRTWASCNDSGGATFIYLQNQTPTTGEYYLSFSMA